MLKHPNSNLEIIKFNGLKTSMVGTIQISGEMHFRRKWTRKKAYFRYIKFLEIGFDRIYFLLVLTIFCPILQYI